MEIPYGGKPYIFVSYSHRNTSYIRSVVSRMGKLGYRVWCDDDLPFINDYNDVIANSIMNCQKFVVFLSRDSVKSEYVLDELYLARTEGKDIITVYIENCQLPPGVKMRLGRFNHINLDDYRNRDELIELICTACADCHGVIECAPMFSDKRNSKSPQKSATSTPKTNEHKPAVPVSNPTPAPAPTSAPKPKAVTVKPPANTAKNAVNTAKPAVSKPAASTPTAAVPVKKTAAPPPKKTSSNAASNSLDNKTKKALIVFAIGVLLIGLLIVSIGIGSMTNDKQQFNTLPKNETQSNSVTVPSPEIQPKSYTFTHRINGYDFEFTADNNELTLDSCPIDYSGKLTLPANIDGMPIVCVGYKAFYNCSVVTSIILPDSLRSIDMQAFYGCSNLANISIPDNVEFIGSHAFYGCTNLNSIVLPSKITSIRRSTFYRCSSLTNIVIPDSVTEIYECAFQYCTSLTDISLPNSLTSIGYNAFCGCENLVNLSIPSSVTYIGSSAFYSCSSITNISIPYGATVIESHTFYNCTNLSSVTIPNSVTKIDDEAFYFCESLIAVIIPDSVTKIGNRVFSQCTNLTSITISENVKSIGDNALGYVDRYISTRVTVYCPRDSYAWKYCERNMLPHAEA